MESSECSLNAEREAMADVGFDQEFEDDELVGVVETTDAEPEADDIGGTPKKQGYTLFLLLFEMTYQSSRLIPRQTTTKHKNQTDANVAGRRRGRGKNAAGRGRGAGLQTGWEEFLKESECKEYAKHIRLAKDRWRKAQRKEEFKAKKGKK